MRQAPTSRIRLLAVDLDGTLLGPDRKIVPENVEALRLARQEGVTVVLASGRIHASILPFANEIGLDGPFICANGAHVVGEHRKELAFLPLDRSAKRTIIDFALEGRIQLNAYTRNELLFLQETEWLDLYRSRVRSVVPRLTIVGELMEIDLAKLLMVGKAEEIVGIRKSIEPLLERRSVRLTESEPEYLEFLDPKANKGNGLQTIAGSMGIDQLETAAIGDYLNDIEMLQCAGFSAVVENGAPEAKQVADVVVASNVNAGVSRFIDSYVLNQQE